MITVKETDSTKLNSYRYIGRQFSPNLATTSNRGRNTRTEIGHKNSKRKPANTVRMQERDTSKITS